MARRGRFTDVKDRLPRPLTISREGSKEFAMTLVRQPMYATSVL